MPGRTIAVILAAGPALFALAAAVFWLLSARVRLPPLGPVRGKVWWPEVSSNEFHEAAVRKAATLEPMGCLLRSGFRRSASGYAFSSA